MPSPAILPGTNKKIRFRVRKQRSIKIPFRSAPTCLHHCVHFSQRFNSSSAVMGISFYDVRADLTASAPNFKA